ncbi:hypothetical protein KGF56_003058 [Candida oxycetoniae]|uniref:Amino acid permease/ SLC12A domain-containing protein n=1 Tax=Candida oxycetoniae TaxID=497107 RepID=A0AAI9SW30_9ASCO|nr:uncharacterized protein KGF56_003058 [Candida oxycetoniae]KAI3404158.2 hypothetical protein KGF56_003058 [Candida oxycetoniae]
MSNKIFSIDTEKEVQEIDSVKKPPTSNSASSSIISTSNELVKPRNNRWRNFCDSFKPPPQPSVEDYDDEQQKHRPTSNSDSTSSCSLRDIDAGLDLEYNEQKTSPSGGGGSPLKQSLKKRQIKMIALGGCVGSGLLVASGDALKDGGPASMLIAWAIVSSFLYCTMQALAELSSSFPVSGSFATYSIKFIDPSWGFAMGWNYVLLWIVVLPLELVASSMTINFWNSNINSVVWVAIFYVLIIVLNLCGNQGFGETEFVASIIKLLGIVGFDILAIVLICGGGKQGYIGGKNWHPPFAHGFKGVISVLLTATYSLAGTELVGLTSAESAGDARKILPKAIKQVVWRILIFYMLTLTLIGFLVKAEDATSSSPFVIAIQQGGIKALPSVFNVVILVALLAIGNSAVYGFSRTILALAEQGLAPQIFMYVDRKGRPLVGIAVSAFVGLMSFVSASKYQDEVFSWLVAISGLSTLFTWGSINVAHIRFRSALKVQNRSLDDLPYRSNTGLIGSYYGIIMILIVLGLQFWLALFPIGKPPSAQYFFKIYLGAVIAISFYIAHKLWTRHWVMYIRAQDIDLDNGKSETDLEMLRQTIKEEKEEYRAKPLYYKIYNFWC